MSKNSSRGSSERSEKEEDGMKKKERPAVRATEGGRNGVCRRGDNNKKIIL